MTTRRPGAPGGSALPRLGLPQKLARVFQNKPQGFRPVGTDEAYVVLLSSHRPVANSVPSLSLTTDGPSVGLAASGVHLSLPKVAQGAYAAEALSQRLREHIVLSDSGNSLIPGDLYL